MDKGNWTYRKLGEVAESELGKTLDSKKNTGNLNPYLCAVNVQWDRFELDALKEMKFEEWEKERYSIREGDLVVCEGGDIGRCAIWNKKETVLYQNALHRVRFNGEMLPRFCMYFLMNLKKSGELDAKYGKGVTIKHLVKSSLLSIPVPIPPLPIQQRIVAELDCISSILEKKRQQLKELDNLAQSIFYDMFGDPVENEKEWEVKTMGEIGTLQRGSGLSKKDLVEDGYPCILYGQIHTRFGAYTKAHIACIPYNLVNTAKIAHTGDLIMAITSEDIEGSCKSTAWLGNYDIAIGSDAAIFRHNQNGIYISYYTKTKAFYIEKAKYARGFKVTHISTKEIATIPIMIPPLALQQSFAAKIEAIEKQKERISQSIKEVQTLFDSRMQEYFG